MAFWNVNTRELATFRPGSMSKAKIGTDLIMVCMQINVGKEDAGYTHPFDQRGTSHSRYNGVIGQEPTIMASFQRLYRNK